MIESCYFCGNCRRKTHTDEEVGPEESYATFWCSMQKVPVDLPRESVCDRFRRKNNKKRGME